jgi:hypothetical protein
MVGSWLANRSPATRDRIEQLALIDAALYTASFLMIWWAFGLRALALAALIFGVGYPWAYFWTGGAFARIPWLFMAVSGVCLLKKARPVMGGFALMWSPCSAASP